MSKYGIPSTTPPTEPGWYWRARTIHNQTFNPDPVEVLDMGGTMFFSEVGNFALKESTNVLWWPIPIEVPEVPK